MSEIKNDESLKDDAAEHDGIQEVLNRRKVPQNNEQQYRKLEEEGEKEKKQLQHDTGNSEEIIPHHEQFKIYNSTIENVSNDQAILSIPSIANEDVEPTDKDIQDTSDPLKFDTTEDAIAEKDLNKRKNAISSQTHDLNYEHRVPNDTRGNLPSILEHVKENHTTGNLADNLPVGNQMGREEEFSVDSNSSSHEQDESTANRGPRKSITSQRSTGTQTPRHKLSLDPIFTDYPDFSVFNEQLTGRLSTRETQTSNSSSSSTIPEDVENEGGIKDKRPSMYGADHPILPKRYILLLMMFLGFAVVYSLRVNINVAIVAMVNNRTRITKSGKIVVHVSPGVDLTVRLTLKIVLN